MSTHLIDISGYTQAAPPATKPFVSEGRTWSPVLLTIVAAALGSGQVLVTDREMQESCTSGWLEALPFSNECLTATDGQSWQVIGKSLKEERERLCELKPRLEAAPRGTWALLRQDWNVDGRAGTSWIALISDGQGRAYQPQTSHLQREPTHEDLVDSLVSMEIYLARRAEEERREQLRSRATIRARQWAVGTQLKKPAGALQGYSSGVIEGIREDGRITVRLKKRGSRNRWRWIGFAHSVRMPSEPSMPAARGQLVVTQSA